MKLEEARARFAKAKEFIRLYRDKHNTLHELVGSLNGEVSRCGLWGALPSHYYRLERGVKEDITCRLCVEARGEAWKAPMPTEGMFMSSVEKMTAFAPTTAPCMRCGESQGNHVMSASKLALFCLNCKARLALTP